jgi:hypothetical protein
MKLLTYTADGRTDFGCVVGSFACSFDVLGRLANMPHDPYLDSGLGYVNALPASFGHAQALERKAWKLVDVGQTEDFHHLDEVKIEAPLAPTAILDFGLTPKHLVDSARTLMRYEFGPIVGPIAAWFLARGIRRTAQSPVLPYFKENHHNLIGDGDEMGWPAYTSYLDIEPELAFVVGNGGCIAGYTIWNDASARDVQFPEMLGTGPARAKDFARGNGLGPFLVTPDAVPEPRGLAVTAQIGARMRWSGTTSEIRVPPEDVLAFLKSVFEPAPGTLVGLGTIPGTTGLDHDTWIEPGDEIAITIDGLGTLRQRVPAPPTNRAPSRWKSRHL